MQIRVSSKGQTVIPASIRRRASIRAGDDLDVGYVDGLVVMRKRQPLTAERVRDLLRAGHKLPEMTEADEVLVSDALERVRGRAMR